MDLKDIIKEEYKLILEGIYEITEDVNFIYDSFFAYDVEKIQNGGKFDNTFNRSVITSGVFTTEILKKAHKTNPIRIIINDYKISNAYNYKEKILYIGVNRGALGVVSDYDNLVTAVKDTGLYGLNNEFKESKFKGSIRHELIHYLDDTFTGLFSKSKRFSSNEKWSEYRRKNYVYADKFEINALIGNIIELKNSTNDRLWNRLSFEDMIDMSASLKIVRNELKKLSDDKYNKWKKDILSRMAREGLLGDKMKHT